jgi:hypothetical protein
MYNLSAFIYALVDAPSPPDWLLQHANNMFDQGPPLQALQAQMNNLDDDGYSARKLRYNGKTSPNAFNHCYFLDQASLDWAKKNITEMSKDIRIASTLPGLERCGAHVDRIRNYTLIYLLETGGPDHKTVFYREKGQNALFRPGGYHVDDYSNLDHIIEIKQIPMRWNLVQAKILHSVENILEGRKSIQISLDDISGLKLLDAIYV